MSYIESDITIIASNIEKQKRYTTKVILILFVFFIFILFSLIFIGLKSHSVFFSKENTNGFSFKKQNSSILSKDTSITNFLEKSEKFVIDSKYVDTKSDNFNILNDCVVTTPHIRNKIYRGNTKIIYVNSNDRSFFIPYTLYLTNNNNKQNNYISTKKCSGIFSEKIKSDEPFAINDEELFLSGDNFFFLHKNKYLKVTKNTHLIYRKNNNKNEQQDEIYDIRSVKMEAFGDKKYINFYENVQFKTNNSIINSQFTKIYLDEKNNPKDIFFSKKINAFQEKNKITSDFGYFDVKKNLLILYKNVLVKSENNSSSGEYYFYNTENKTTVSFNENTIFYNNKQSDVYNILQKLAKEVNKYDKNQIFQFIEKNKKNIANRAIKYSENYNIDRTKRTTAVLTD